MEVVKAPAKINLHLRVGPRRADGFHSIMSWFCTTGGGDLLVFSSPPEPGLKLTCKAGAPWASVPRNDETNLVMRAAMAMQGAMNDEEKSRPRWGGIEITLFKETPTGAGLGGGSSDAASALMGLNLAWQLRWPRQRLADIAAALGSDVPFFLFGPSSVCTGRGEQVRPIPPPRPRTLVMLHPPIHMPTPAVYRKFDEMGLGGEQAVAEQPDWQQWSQLSARELLPLLVNDLEPAAFAISPELKDLRDRTEQAYGRPVRMSGSGSTLFTLFEHGEDAHAAMANLRTDQGVIRWFGSLADPSENDRHWKILRSFDVPSERAKGR